MITVITLLFVKPDNKEIINPYKSYPFYKEELINDYIDYKNKYNLSDKDTIIRVNIGLNKPFYTNVKESCYEKDLSILVNKYNYLDKNYKPKDLMSFYSNGKEIQIRNIVYKNFQDMANAAKKEKLNIRIISGYRDYYYQENLYNSYLKHDKKDVVDTYSARAGYSEHQTGLSIDIDNVYANYNSFHLTKEYIWMKENAYKYGFILRYPMDKENITGFKYESWHYRYVGKDISNYIYKNNITFDEYYYEFLDK